MFEIKIPTNSASRHDARAIVSTPNVNRIPFGIVSVLARTMLAYERLERRRGSSPRARSRSAASTSVSPVGAISMSVAIHSNYRDERVSWPSAVYRLPRR
jgi:hypothetical protein